MIKEEDLLEAIAECQGQRNPNASTCMKLAAFYTILDHVREGDDKREVMPIPAYSYANDPDVIDYTGDTEFASVIRGLSLQDVLSVMDELMTTLQAIYPKLHDAVISKLDGLS